MASRRQPINRKQSSFLPTCKVFVRFRLFLFLESSTGRSNQINSPSPTQEKKKKEGGKIEDASLLSLSLSTFFVVAVFVATGPYCLLPSAAHYSNLPLLLSFFPSLFPYLLPAFLPDLPQSFCSAPTATVSATPPWCSHDQQGHALRYLSTKERNEPRLSSCQALVFHPTSTGSLWSVNSLPDPEHSDLGEKCLDPCCATPVRRIRTTYISPSSFFFLLFFSFLPPLPNNSSTSSSLAILRAVHVISFPLRALR